ncbi:neuferricin isoform X4 [Stegostoma tigrinum]|uniref:neuferricin isoform X4 n=1 Tax=Stegostoma tigrinum TaxID=3053191 RepID=UPI00202B0078|nr:neuferricin isoform X4 [Stegostoma tigrinum]
MLRSLLLCAVCGSVSVLLPADVWRLWSRWFTDWLGIAAGPASVRLFTKSELSRYTGEKGSPGLYLAILGQVFDVKKGKKHYGPGGSYSFFSGKLVGTYYNHNGEPTQVLSDVELAVTQGRKLKAESELENNLFPPCNSEWSSAKGGRVWCSPHSGGVEREWAGVPRKLYRPGSKSHRCVCVRTTGPPSNQPNSAQNRGDLENPSLQEYAGCHSLSVSCALP